MWWSDHFHKDYLPLSTCASNWSSAKNDGCCFSQLFSEISAWGGIHLYWPLSEPVVARHTCHGTPILQGSYGDGACNKVRTTQPHTWVNARFNETFIHLLINHRLARRRAKWYIRERRYAVCYVCTMWGNISMFLERPIYNASMVYFKTAVCEHFHITIWI